MRVEVRANGSQTQTQGGQMNQDAKAYPKAETEVVCFECRKPIYFRDDLHFIPRGSPNYVPIHLGCYMKAWERNRHLTTPLSIEDVQSEVKTARTASRIVFFITFFLMVISLIVWIETETIPPFLSAVVVFFSLSIFLKRGWRVKHKRYVKLWNEYGRHLPEKRNSHKEKINV